MKETMTYFYNYEDLPEVVENEDGTYTVDGKTFADGSVNTPENIVAEIDRRIALLHYARGMTTTTLGVMTTSSIRQPTPCRS